MMNGYRGYRGGEEKEEGDGEMGENRRVAQLFTRC